MTSFIQRGDVLSWGRVERGPQRVASPRFLDEVPRLIATRPEGSLLAIGARRSYGDSISNRDGSLISMQGIDRLISFDSETGILRAEAGATLNAILLFCVPRGWFVPVTPGTRFVTLGGAIANDIHGKNHHAAGTFGRHVRQLSLIRGDGSRTILDADDSSGLFAATIGGLGLTGIIEWADIALERIESSDLDVDIRSFSHLDEFWELASGSIATHTNTVAWIDCTARGDGLGRGIFSRANWSREPRLAPHNDRQRLHVPFEAPSGMLNRYAVTAFNKIYFRAQARKGSLRQHYSKVFHPLDSIADWNRLYGPGGFWQYQCVLPVSSMTEGIRALVQEIAKSGEGSFLSVLKTFGALRSPGLLSFPMEGCTLALDFANRGASTLKLLSRLDGIVSQAGGRLYAAKDGRMPKDMWQQGYADLGRFCTHVDPAFSSDFWKRVGA